MGVLGGGVFSAIKGFRLAPPVRYLQIYLFSLTINKLYISPKNYEIFVKTMNLEKSLLKFLLFATV